MPVEIRQLSENTTRTQKKSSELSGLILARGLRLGAQNCDFRHEWQDGNRSLDHKIRVWSRSANSAGLGATLIVEYTRYKIDEKRRRLFEQAYEKASEALRASSHCLRYELSHCTEDQDSYTLRIEWDSEDGHLKGFRNSPEFKTFFASVQPYVNDIEEMRHYTVISAGDKSHSVSSHA